MGKRSPEEKGELSPLVRGVAAVSAVGLDVE